MARHDGLGLLADAEVAAEPQITDGSAVVAHRKFERRAGVMVPDLVGIDPVPVRAFAGFQQEIDRRAGAASGTWSSEGLDEMTALGMRPQPELRNDFLGCHAGGGAVVFIDGSLEKAENHLASLGRLPRQS